MRRALLALLALCSIAVGGGAFAETCQTIATGQYFWTAIGNNNWSNCTETADDTFVIPTGVTITITGNVTLSTGTIQIQSGGTLIQQGGTTLSWTGATAGGLEVIGGTYQAEGVVLWEGRVSSAVTYAAGAPETAAFTIPLDSISGYGIAATDFVVFGDDDPENIEDTIGVPVQVGAGPPIPGYHRPSYRKWAWHNIETAPATSTLTINTNDFTDVETLAPAADAYDGTRGPALPTNTAITGAPTSAPYSNKTRSRIVYGNIVASDGDLSGQYVEFTSGACSDIDGLGLSRNRSFKIDWVDDEGGGAGVDWVYVWGDATRCGSGVNTRIHYGIREGDPLKIVRPAIVAGTSANAGPSVFVTNGGTFKSDWAQFKYIDAAGSYSTADWTAFCDLCFFYTASVPNLDESYITNTDIAYPITEATAGDTNAIGFMNKNSGGTNTLIGSGTALDLTGMVIDRVYIHDQPFDGSSSSAGVQSVGNYATTGGLFDRIRAERNGDDGFTIFAEGYTNTTATTIKVRQPVITELSEVTGSTNSQQCIDFVGGVTTSASDLLYHTLNVSDALMSGCSDSALNGAGVSNTFDRMAIMGGAAAGVGFKIGPSTNFASVSANLITSYPNITRNAIVSLAGTLTSSQVAEVGGRMDDSIVVGNLGTASARGLFTATELNGVFANFGVDNGSVLARSSSASDLAGRLSATTVRDSVLLNASTNAGDNRKLCRNYNSNSVFTAINLFRTFVGIERSTGLLATTCVTGTDTTQPVTMAGITLSVITQNNQGIGNGTDNQGTDEGRNITYGCVEGGASNLPSSTFSYGAGVTATSIHAPDGLPESGDDVPISAFIRKPGSRSICEYYARPIRVGLTQFGVAHGLLGDGVVEGIELFTTDDALIRTVRGRFTSPLHPGNLHPNGG